MKCDLLVYYSDFRKLCRYKDNEIWCPWLDVRPDGVYLNPPAKELDGEEKTDWYRQHQTKNLAEPVLRFPCSMSDLESFQEEYSVYGCIDAFDMADWILIKLCDPDNTIATASTTDRALGQTERKTLLKLIIGMAMDAYGYDPDANRSPATGEKNGISVKIESRGINIDADTIRKYLTEAKVLL